jgi:hypothetical protein
MAKHGKYVIISRKIPATCDEIKPYPAASLRKPAAKFHVLIVHKYATLL